MASGTHERSVTLPVLKAQGSGSIKHSRMGRRRAIVLLLVYVAVAVHITLWLTFGRTVSPVEPSESMQTLERGVLNAGFIFFVLAIGSTLIFGRFFCGWACHVLALQDGCGWIMRKMGIHPKPFRSRLLVFAPLVFGLYMFVWPSFKSWVVAPSLAAMDVAPPVWLDIGSRPDRLTSELIVEDFWATFPPWYVAIPFFGICGFACVYFLGSKGFCTYGCPYGGIFAPADRLAPTRIRVTDACEHCGHCTAVCTSNVRVHEEVRDFGMVIDPGCMKCMDCVSVCPNDALYVGLGKPALLAKPRSESARHTRAKAKAARRRRFDMTWPEEIAGVLIFAGLFLAFRGMLNLVPMLMAIGMAGVGTFVVFAAWRVLRSPNAKIQNVQLKIKGAIRPTGYTCMALAGVTIIAASWSGYVRTHEWLALIQYRHLDVPVQVAFRPAFAPTPATRGHAHRGVMRAVAAGAFAQGGVGWSRTPDADVRLAYMSLLTGELGRAEDALRRVIDNGHPLSPVIFQLANVMTLRGATDDDVQAMRLHALALHPDLHSVRRAAAAYLVAHGKRDDAVALWQSALATRPDDGELLHTAAAFFASIHDGETAADLLDRAEAYAPTRPRGHALFLLESAVVRAAIDQASEARARMEDALALSDSPEVLMTAARLALLVGDRPHARTLVDNALTDEAGAALLSQGAGVLVALGDSAAALDLLIKAGQRTQGDAWATAGIAARLRELALAAGDPNGLNAAIDMYKRAIDRKPDSPTLHHDLAFALYGAGRDQEAVDNLVRASDLAPTVPIFPERLSGMLERMVRPEEAALWRAEALAREGALRAKSGVEGP